MGSYGFCSRGLVFSEAGLFVIGFGWGKLLFRGSMRRLLFLRCGVCTLDIQTHVQDPWCLKRIFSEACLAFRGFKLTPTNTRYDWGILEVYSLYVWVKPFWGIFFAAPPPTHAWCFFGCFQGTFHPKRMTFDLQQLISELFHFGTVSLTVVHVKWPQRPTLEICWKRTTMSQYQVGNKKTCLIILWKTNRLVVSTHLKNMLVKLDHFPKQGWT